MLTRRAFLGSAAALWAAAESRYRVGITTNTIGGWEKDVFLSFREAHEAGFHFVESFIDYFAAYLDQPDELLKKIHDIGVTFDTISNGGHMETHFEDPARHEKIVEEHLRLARFVKRLGCESLEDQHRPAPPGGYHRSGSRAHGDGARSAWPQDQRRGGHQIRRACAHVDAARKSP
jgi:sugar phosphate isomerase/epimerase